MIDHNNHHSRYCELMSLASRSAPARRRDCGYMAAIYILSADPELFALSRDKIGPDGINFSRIRASVRRLELSDSQRTAAEASNSLFNDGFSSVTPHDLSQCDYATLDIITQALYIWKGGCIITPSETGAICLDRSEERKRRCLEAHLFRNFLPNP